MSELESCMVCQGRQWIRLPLYRSVSAVQPFDPDRTPVIEENSRQYDCPECVKKVRCERVGALKVKNLMEPHMTPAHEAWWREHATKFMTAMIADRLLESGFVKFEPIPADKFHAEGIMATVRAVMPKDMNPFDNRVTDEAIEIAEEVGEEAIRLIDNWNSYYCAAEILKQDARREVRDAVRTVKGKRGRK